MPWRLALGLALSNDYEARWVSRLCTRLEHVDSRFGDKTLCALDEKPCLFTALRILDIDALCRPFRRLFKG
jgi:hypothetical protein